MAKHSEKNEPKREERREAKMPAGARRKVEAKEAKGMPFGKGGKVKGKC